MSLRIRSTTKGGGKVTAVAKERINQAKYGRLLARTRPFVIKTEEENERLLAEVRKLLKKGDNISPEEERLLELLSVLIEQFEEKAYPIPIAAPHAVIQMLMEDRGLRQRDLLTVLGSRGVTSDVVNGRRKPSKKQAKALGDFFGVSPELFIESLE
jgi:HTH-type transcriptional regulator / antitoxin HigA